MGGKFDANFAARPSANPVVWPPMSAHITKIFVILPAHPVTKPSRLGCTLTIISASTQVKSHSSAPCATRASATRPLCSATVVNMMAKGRTAVKFVERPFASRLRLRLIQESIQVTSLTYVIIVASHLPKERVSTTTRGLATTTLDPIYAGYVLLPQSSRPRSLPTIETFTISHSHLAMN